MITTRPHPNVEMFSKRRAAPTFEIKQASSATPETTAAARKAFCLIRVDLNISVTLYVSLAELLFEDTLRVGQCLRSVDILPYGILNIERA